MKDYLKKITRNKNGFKAEFSNGAYTFNEDAASFFMIMQDKNASLEEVEAYIKMGRKVDAAHDYDEIERILFTFKSSANHNAA